MLAKKKPKALSLYEFNEQFPDEESARKFFETQIWAGGCKCPHCQSKEVVEVKNHKPMPYRCKDCRKHFSVRTNTVLAESKVPLRKWLLATYLMTTARKGVPSTQLARELGLTQKTAWFLAQRIREAWVQSGGQMGPAVEMDETYFGGKSKNKHASQRKGKIGTKGKQAVFGILERDGKVTAMPIKYTDRYTLHPIIEEKVKPGSILYTDNHPAYQGLKGYKHKPVNHSVGEYVRKQAHTNGVESFWALLKRGYYGVYHKMSAKHLHRYINEFANRHNTAKEATMRFMELTACSMLGRRLTYAQLTHAT